MNKKGSFNMIILSILLVVALIIVALFFFSSAFRWVLIGSALIVISFIVLLGNSITSNVKIWVFLGLLAGGLVIILSSGVLQEVMPSNVKLAIPHQASYKCDLVGSGSPTYTIPLNGIWISKDEVPSDRATSIKATDVGSFPYWGGGARYLYKVCNQNKDNCQEYIATSASQIPASIDIQTTSLFIQLQSRTTLLSSWKAVTDPRGTIQYTYQKFGLRLYSTSGDTGGKIICESSCDLSCPTQAYREKLVGSPINSLNPYESVPYLEYWEDIDYDLNSQGGASVYDGNKFCLGNNIYGKSSIEVGGITYIYPNTAERTQVECCNGAVISTSSQDKKCVNNRWQVITKDTALACMSDYNCPNQGLNTCQNKILSGWHCVSGRCVKSGNDAVQCCSQADCPSDQVCQDNKCVGGQPVSPVDLTNQSNNNLACNKWYQEKGVKTTYKYNILGIKFGAVNNPVCKTANWVYLSIIIVVIGGIAIFSVYRVTAKGRKK